jgi:UDPglucose 6-dehydrogenase
MFITLGTPTRGGDGHADLSYVYARGTGPRSLAGYAVIVTKSTVPVGTGRRISDIVRRAGPDLDFDVASNPEVLRERNAIDDFRRPDHVVIGAESERPREVPARPLTDRSTDPVHWDQVRSQLVRGHEAHFHQRNGRYMCARRC